MSNKYYLITYLLIRLLSTRYDCACIRKFWRPIKYSKTAAVFSKNFTLSCFTP